jgi:ER membrane protein complex subunit 8/9
MALTYVLQDAAFLKLLLHSAKYPPNSINGVLLGNKDADGTVTVVDCIPLLHSGLSLAPCIEVALAQACPVPCIYHYHFSIVTLVAATG